MTLLDFARGPGLQASLAILVFGSLWRLFGTLLLRYKKPLSQPRSRAILWGGLRTIVTRSWPRREFQAATVSADALGYIFHIGLAIVVFGFVPHILFIKGLTGLSWPGLPSNIIMAVGAIVVAVLIALLVRRLSNPVLRLISNADDYLSWFVTLLPVVTGMLAFGHLLLRYETMLAVHILSVELLFVWFPFSKLMHALLVFPARAQLGMRFERKGVRA
jgi:nitrate reductase gamma subunit